MKTLRPWQDDGVKAIQKSWPQRVLYVAPQGAGKTLVAVRAVGKRRVLWVTPTRETAIQAYKELSDHGFKCGYLLADAPVDTPTTADAWVGTVASVRLYDPVDVEVIVIDEAHHTPAPTWRKLLDEYPNSERLGLTGSPWRMDGQPLGDHFDVLIQGPKPSKLIDHGQLAEPLVYTWNKDIDLPTKTAGDYGAEVLQEASEKILVGDIYETWTKRARTMQTIVFASTLDHSRQIQDLFLRQGINAGHIDSKMSTRERDIVLSRFKSHAIQVITTVGVLSEGWDMPDAQCMISARPMRSLTMWLQQCGRVTRPGMKRIILDHAGNALRLLHPSHDRDWSLDCDAEESSAKAGTLVPCPICQLLIAPQCRVCPGCGHKFDERERAELKVVAGELTPLRRLTPRERWNRLVEGARRRGVYLYIAEEQYFRAYGEKPPKEWYPEDQSGLGDYEILLLTAKRLGRTKAEAVAEFKAMRDRDEFMPRPRVRLPQMRDNIKKLVKVPVKVSLTDAPAFIRARLKTLILAELEKSAWNIEKATKALGLSFDVVETYCAEEYKAAKTTGRITSSMTQKESRRLQDEEGKETTESGARRYGISSRTLHRRLVNEGLVIKDERAGWKVRLFDKSVIDAVMVKHPSRNQKPTHSTGKAR